VRKAGKIAAEDSDACADLTLTDVHVQTALDQPLSERNA
jgi:hypothetical protein